MKKQATRKDILKSWKKVGPSAGAVLYISPDGSECVEVYPNRLRFHWNRSYDSSSAPIRPSFCAQSKTVLDKPKDASSTTFRFNPKRFSSKPFLDNKDLPSR